MRALIDTNVALTYVSGREDKFSEQSDKIMLMCAEEKVDGYLAFHSLSTIWYVTRKVPDEIRRDWIKQICTVLTVVGAENSTILSAVEDTDFTDFEDALQDCCAIDAEVDYIVTVNTNDFINHSRTKAVTPEEFLTIVTGTD
ncbi:MAG: PIN domain-containing protein [Clostridia bacterium]|nr:PIN domain-containing protein [Clostridia bacterium]